ncbi:MAG TPA: sugar phosphate isomerase/epimerase [Chitinophagaceae bacterium]|nr:sugar phosphate isomerase/epimerase [Chitinophagaceae bacterium]
MIKRREFLKTTGAAAMSTLLSSGDFWTTLLSKKYPVGLQLFTFFNQIDDDVPGTLKKIAAIGYKEIESAFSKKGGYYGMKPGEFSKIVSDVGMSWKSHHVLGAPFKMPANAKPMTDAKGNPITFPPMRNLKENTQELVDETAEAGVPYLVCASTPVKTADEIKGSIEVLNKTGEACRKANITLAYHNHTGEFEKIQGESQTAYNMFLSQLSPDIKMELDLCWATKAGIDPVELFNKHKERFHLWHVKDLNKEKQGPAPVGEGIIDFKGIFDNADVAGMKHFFVEHDMPADPYASITTSYNNLQKIMS